MLTCDCGWKGTDLIPHPDGTARCPRCHVIFVGITAKDAIHDLDTLNWMYRTRPHMNAVKGSWIGAWEHYWRYKEHYDTVREADRNKLCPATGKTRLWSDGVTLTKQCLHGECRTCDYERTYSTKTAAVAI